MKASLGFLLAFILGVQCGRSFVPTTGPEADCLKEQNLKLSDVEPEIHIVSDVNNEVVGRFFVCVWKKREIFKTNGEISGEGIYRRFAEIFKNVHLSESIQLEMKDAFNECTKLRDNTDWILANKVKNCIFHAVQSRPHLPRPQPEN
ncbi:hypothetical protein PPYR_00683 [Photinus pyralis]|nr:uncharacterized protein LOC116173451 [Photinus pyralis]KAB0803713.1 hypothetical protein PPYR_00683 [Photinus pyralis]